MVREIITLSTTTDNSLQIVTTALAMELARQLAAVTLVDREAAEAELELEVDVLADVDKTEK